MTAMDNLATGLGLMFGLPLMVAGVVKVVDEIRARRASRRRLAAQPDLSPEALAEGLERPRAAVLIPAQRAGEHGAR